MHGSDLGVAVGTPEPHLLRLTVPVPPLGGGRHPGLAALRVAADAGPERLAPLDLITGQLLITRPNTLIPLSGLPQGQVSWINLLDRAQHGAGTQSLHPLTPVDGRLPRSGALTSPDVASHVLRGRGEEAPVVLVRLEDDDVELGSEVKSQSDVG